MNEKSIWQEIIEVRTYETDFQGVWKPAAFFRAMEEATVHHSEALKTDYLTLQKYDLAWVLARNKIRFIHFPETATRVVVKTWPKGVQQKIFGMRDYSMSTEDGRPIALSTSAWLVINTKTRRFVKPDQLPNQLPLNEGLSALDENLNKMAHPGQMQILNTFQARYSSLDLMGHVNNTHYVDWIFDSFPIDQIRGRKLEWLQINFSSEVKPDEIVDVSVGEDPHQNLIYSVVGMNRNTNVIAFDAQFGLKEMSH
jgi:acyl-ACP thioesterase